MNIEQLKQEIRDNIRDNGKGAITGQILRDVLIDMASKIADAEEMAGKDGVGIARIETSPASNNTTRVTIYLDNGDSTSFDIKNGKDGINGRDGRDGADGRNGADGINGVDGRPGADGRNGADGADGREGAQGKSGAQGPVGPSGSVTDGAQGPTGPMGAKGSDGARGAQGPVGPAGSSSSGSQGPMGERGTDGSRGAQGAKGPSGSSGAQGPAGDGADTELFERLEEELEQYKTAVSGRLESIQNDIESGAEEAVGEALSRLNLTADELANLRDRLNEAAQNAQSALDLARLMGSGGTIDPEVLADIMSRINGANDWINNYSGHIMTMWDEYNASMGYLGRAGIGIDPSKGMIGLLGENINTISGTVGTVKGEWDASKGRITQMATWYDESASTYANAIQEIDAMNARITNMVEYVCDSAITSCQEYVNGQMAEIGRIVAASGFSGFDLTYIEDKINAISGYAHTEIDRFHGMSGDLTTIIRDLKAEDGSLLTRITNTSAGLKTARDMMESWTQESGMLRTVSDLIIKKDSEGYPIFWYIDPEQTGDDVQKIRVYYQGKDTSGKVYFTTTKNGTGQKYYDNVYPDYMTGAFSFMNQKVNSIEMGVTSGDVLAALNLSVEDGTSRINLLADRVNIDADTFVRALSAETANIAGVKFGGGIICGGTQTKYWKMDGQGNFEAENGTFKGTVYADNGEFRGKIVATELVLEDGASINVTPEDVGIDTSQFIRLDSAITGNQGEETYVSRQGLLRAKNAIISGNVYATNSYLKGSVYADSGYFRGSVSATNGYFNGEIIASAGTIGGLKISKDGISGANINITNNYFFSNNVGIQGSISADNGYFRGDIYANNGYFKGTLCGATGTFGGKLTAAEGSFNGAVTATSLTLGGQAYSKMPSSLSSGDVRHIVGQEANSHGWITTGDGYYQINHPIGENFNVSTDGLLVAKNAILSGGVYATNGVFSGTVYATDGKFKGSISAENGYFKGELKAAKGSFSGALTATSLTLGGANYTSMPSSLSDSDVRGIIGEEASSHGWITTGDGYYKINSPVGDNFKVDTDGLLVANNAILSGSVYARNGVFSGTVYATDGKFKGNISADSGYFKGTLCAATGTFGGKLTAAEGSFKGAVSATSLYLGGQSYTEMPEGDPNAIKKGVAVSGAGGSLFCVSDNGLLRAENAIINGTVIATDGSFRGSISATNGYFSGEINASDIILNGHALKFSANGNTFLIQDGDISVDYITTTESMQGLQFNGTETDSDGMKSGWTYHEFDITGTTTINFPPMRGRVSGWYNNPDSQQSSPGTISSEICYYLLNEDQVEYLDWGKQKLASGTYMRGNTGSTANSVSNTGSIEGNDLYVGLTGGSSSNSTASIQLQEGHYVIYVTYMIDTPATIWNASYWNQVNAQLYDSTFINTPNTVNTQFFRIGNNGMQCFMPGGYSFTAANRKSGTETGPVISLIGANGTCGLKIDSNGIKIKRNSTEGWRDIAVS